MKLSNCDEIPAHDLMVPGAKDVSIRVLIGPDDAPSFIMMLLEVSPGGFTPDHSHEWEEEIFIKSGHATLKTDEGEKSLRVGDALILDPNMAHRFINSSDEPLQFICVIPKRD
jgi:quercetin dioxygenase-like cupin family protein